jgi:hypothetical protein
MQAKKPFGMTSAQTSSHPISPIQNPSKIDPVEKVPEINNDLAESNDYSSDGFEDY